MKKIFASTFCTLMICGLLLTIGTVMAAEPGYERTGFLTQVTPTIDGMWTSPDEWTDGEESWIGTDVVFRSTYDNDMTRWIVEFLTDTTNDPGDKWVFCVDGDQVASTANWRFEITGHTEIIWYLKGAQDWTEADLDIDLEWADSLSASPTSSTPHWILEFQTDKSVVQLQMGDVWNFFLQAFDASNPVFYAWPPTGYEYPEEWGVETDITEPIPEGLTFAVMALLTTVSMVVGCKYFIKRKETKTQ